MTEIRDDRSGLPPTPEGQASESAPRVSIGLPVFNGEKYLREALDSLLAQTYTDFEVVLCDNASTDATEEICREYARRDERVKVHRNSVNLGAAKNFNLSFELARGNYFRWMGHDDRLHPEYLECCVAELDRAPDDVALVFTWVRYIDRLGEPISERRGRRIRGIPEDEQFRAISFTRLLRLPPSAAPIFVFGLIRSEVLSKTRLIGSYIASDLVINAELRLLGEFREIPRHLFEQRIHLREIQRSERSTLRGEAEWFDPKAKRSLLLPGMRLCIEFLKGIRRLDLGREQGIRAALAVGGFAGVRFGQFLHEISFKVWSRVSLSCVRDHTRSALLLRLWCLLAALRAGSLAAIGVAFAPPQGECLPLGLVVFGALRMGKRVEPQSEEMILAWLESRDEGKRIGAALATVMDFERYRDLCTQLWAESGRETDLRVWLQRIAAANKPELMALRSLLPGLGASTSLVDELVAMDS